jgi:hypothetical protein
MRELIGLAFDESGEATDASLWTELAAALA